MEDREPRPEEGVSRRVRSVLSALEWRIVLTALLVLGAFAQTGTADGKRSLELSESLVVDRSLSIDGVVARDEPAAPRVSPSGNPESDPNDRSWFDGHYYIGVAPGLSFLGAPATAVVAPIMTRIAPALWRPRFVRHGLLHLASTWLVIVPLGALTALLVHRAHERLLRHRERSVFLTFCYVFGTASFYYAASFSSWPVINVVSWLFIASVALSPEAPRPWVAVALGVGAALAFSVNYFGGILLPLFLGLLAFRRAWKSAFLLGVGFGLGAVPTLLYNWSAFGSPFSTGYQYRIDANVNTLMSAGVQGFQFPSLVIALKLLVHPYYGLFVYSPIMILALFGLRFVRREGVLAFGAAGALLVLALVAGRHADFHSAAGGMGSRYLAPMLPFAWLLAVRGADRVPARVVEYLGLFSVAVAGMGAMFGAKTIHLYVSQFLIRGPEVPALRWLAQVIEENTERHPPVDALGLLLLLGVALWLVWRPRPLLTNEEAPS
jgi:hypothetical protein